jgi:hypothetical protein
MRVVGLEAMSGASLSGFHAQAARLSALANSITTPESDESEQQESEFRASEYGRQEGDGDQAEIQTSSEDETAYRPNTEAFDAGADIWAMLSVIQRD